MTFIVQAISGKPGEGSFTVNKATKKDALETALGLMGQGMTGSSSWMKRVASIGMRNFKSFLSMENSDATRP
jgi:hypothetical protein